MFGIGFAEDIVNEGSTCGREPGWRSYEWSETF